MTSTSHSQFDGNNINDLIRKHGSNAVECIRPLFAKFFPQSCPTAFLQRITRLFVESFSTAERKRSFVEACYRMPTLSVVGSVRAFAMCDDFRSDVEAGVGPLAHCLLHAEKLCRGIDGAPLQGATERRLPVTEASLGGVSAKLIVGLACAMYNGQPEAGAVSIDDVQASFVTEFDRVHTATMIQEVWRFVRRAVVYRAGLPLYSAYALRPDEAPVDLDDGVQYAHEVLAFLRGMFSSVETVPSGFLDQMLFTKMVRSADTLGQELFPGGTEKRIKDTRDMFARAFHVPIFCEGVSDAMDLAQSFCVHQLLRSDGAQEDLDACMQGMRGSWDRDLREPTDLALIVRTGLRGSYFRSDARYCPFLA